MLRGAVSMVHRPIQRVLVAVTLAGVTSSGLAAPQPGPSSGLPAPSGLAVPAPSAPPHPERSPTAARDAPAGGSVRDAARDTDPPGASPGSTAQTPLPDALARRLGEAAEAFSVQDYPRVVGLLEGLSGHPALAGRVEHRRMLEWLGAAHWFSGNREAARLAFGTLLRESPFHVLDTFIYPPELIDEFDQIRAGLAAGGVIPGRPAEPRSPLRTVLRLERRNATPMLAYFAPLGVGQFANGEAGKGSLLAALQGIGAVTMVATWLGVESLKVDGTDRVRPSEGGAARALDALWYAGFGLLSASWGWSVADGLLARDPRPRLIEERTLEAPAPPVASLHLRPLIGATGLTGGRWPDSTPGAVGRAR
jgi:hypothetical protein